MDTDVSKQQEIDNSRWQTRNVDVPVFIFLRVCSASLCLILLYRCCADQKWPTGHKSENIKKQKKTTSNSQSQCTKIALLQPHDSLDYPRRSPPSDVTRYEKWWIQELVSCIGDGWKGKTNKEEDNPQIGTAVWRGYYWKKNASRRCIQILCQPSKPDLMGFSIKSWTWQVTAIYSAGTVEKRLIKITQCDNEAILVLSFVYFYIYF